MTLRRAITRLGFVQADPIRAPARAQDLILRHRVKDYRAGDLEARYAQLGIEEDFLYAYGFMPKETLMLLHPRLKKALTTAEQQVLKTVASSRGVHPRQVEQQLGRERQLNPWGGYSQWTTRALHALHFRGLLRVSGREKGIRMYEAVSREQDFLEPEERLRRLVLLIARILAPLSVRSLQAAVVLLGVGAPALQGRRSVVNRLLTSGDLIGQEVQDIRYVWPADLPLCGNADDQVRFLAPFDPIVWDRRRFEHLWGWAYRFEAYTPPAKRIRGYYAMPMLWRDQVIGWVNVSRQAGELAVEAGFEGKAPRDKVFKNEFAAEVERFRRFLVERGAEG